MTVDPEMGHITGGLFNTKDEIDNKGAPDLTVSMAPASGKGPF